VVMGVRVGLWVCAGGLGGLGGWFGFVWVVWVGCSGE
jgi:hypothetical protein